MHFIHSSFSSSVDADIRYTECFPNLKKLILISLAYLNRYILMAHTAEIIEIYSQWKKFSSNQLFSSLVTMLLSRNFFQK